MLPLEIRFEVYRYLLGRYAKHEHDMKSKEYDSRRGSILNGPDHSYDFQPSILGVNQQIREEAIETFLRENAFVSLSFDVRGRPDPYPEDYSPWNVSGSHYSTFRDCGVVVIAACQAARAFPFVGMSIGFDSGLGRKNSIDVVFTVDDLPAACVCLQRKINQSIEAAGYPYLAFRISPEVERVAYLWDEAWPVPGTQYNKCLEPLRQIRGASQVSVFEERNACYTAILDIVDPQLSPKETMDLVAMSWDQGDDQFLAGAFKLAIDEYKAAFHTIQRCAFKRNGLDEEIVGGRFSGLTAGEARDDATVLLHAQIAATFLELGKHRLARVYVERIYGPLATYDNRHNAQKLPLKITTGQVHVNNPAAYAKLLAVAASISLAHGHFSEAIEELSEATELDPLNLDIRRRLKEVDDRRRVRDNRRQATLDRQKRSYVRRLQEAIQVARLRSIKGDKAVREHNHPLARQMYEAAHAKMKFENPYFFIDWDVDRERYDLEVRLVSKLIVVALELQDHESIHRWANLSIRKRFDLRDAYAYAWTVDENPGDAADYTNEAGHIAHYGKAVAFQKQGKITAAIGEFALALQCDEGCRATYYQLESLKRMETEEDKLQHQIDLQLERERERAEEREADEGRWEEEEAAEREMEEGAADNDEDRENN